ncbi:hypothetical protein EDC94DRAFT_622033 [Helicostylum pulchrum]|nr:hypothetical protein EDC94DRAFT_622033 [Helicostylum pulchrum]
MQSYQETDTVQDLFDEIEHLIDIPFDQTSYKPIKNKDFHYKEEESDNSYSFERPILIESDSDDIEEELVTPNQAHCFKCDTPIFSTTDSLQVINNNNICLDCSTKKRSRSSSFTFSQLADKLKQSFGHSSSNTLLAPNIKTVDRRKSMPSMNSLFDQSNLGPPSPVPSRPSSRASSFIEDVKQFLAPLSRKNSRNSMHQDYQSMSPPTLEKKSSHQSLFDAINICKPSKPKQSPSYERRVIQVDEDAANHWVQDEFEFGAQAESSILPLRRKQIKQIESRQDRIDIYNNAYLECMNVETSLVPWIIKQTQKGPPDAWFGYTPPTREPKKIMGIFKRKPKENSNNLRAQQQQLGDDLLNRSTPLLQHRYSNSNLSISPNNSFGYVEDDQVTHSPVGYEEEEEEEYFEEQDDMPSLTTSFSPIYANESELKTQSSQPVSILKKTHPPQPCYDDYYDEGLGNTGQEYYTTKDQRRYSSVSPGYEQPMYAAEPPVSTTERRRGRKSNSRNYHNEYDRREEDYYNYHRHTPPAAVAVATPRNSSSRQYEEPTYFNDSIVVNKKRSSSRHSGYEEPRQSYKINHQEYYGMSVKMTPFMMEEWDIALDDLCDLYPRLDRHYINDFLRSAQGDFVTAKDMIMNMIMEIR